MCAAYGLGEEEIKERAAFFVERCRLWQSGAEVPPMPGEGEE